MALDFHSDARKNFDAKGNRLLAGLTTEPLTRDEPSTAEYRPDLLATSVLGPDEYKDFGITTFRDGEGRIIGKWFIHDQHIVGLKHDAYQELHRLSRDMRKTRQLRDAASGSLVERLVFEWVRARATSATELSLSTFVLSKVEPMVGDFQVVLPLFHVSLERPIRLGGVVIRDLKSLDYDQWEPSAGSAQADGFAGYRRERELHQGRAAAIVEASGEPQRAFESALERAETAIALLRLFSPGLLSPLVQSHVAVFGKQHHESTKHYLIKESKLVRIGQSIARDEDFAWQLSAERIEHTYAKQFARLDQLLTKQRSDFQDSLFAVLLVYSRAALRSAIEDKLLYVVVALDSLLLRDDSEPIGDNVAVRIAWVIGQSTDDRAAIVRLVRAAYSLRSRFVHHGKIEWTDEDLETVRQFMRKAWLFFMQLIIDSERYTTRADFINTLERKKLGG